MSFRIVYPVAAPVDGKDFKEAVKNYIKLNRFMNIEQLILTDQYNHMRANVRYLNDSGKRKASIQLSPMDAAAVAAIPPIGFASTNPNAPYPNVQYPGSFVMGPSSIGAPARIIAPAPLMVARPAVPALAVAPGMPGVAGMIYGSRPAETSTSSGTQSASTPAESFGPVAVLTNSRQILPVKPVRPIGTDGKPITGMPVPFGVGVSAAGRPVPFVGGPLPAPVGLVPVATPVRFGAGL